MMVYGEEIKRVYEEKEKIAKQTKIGSLWMHTLSQYRKHSPALIYCKNHSRVWVYWLGRNGEVFNFPHFQQYFHIDLFVQLWQPLATYVKG